MIYLHSAAVVKLAHAEPESAALRRWLDERAETGWISSVITEIEAFRVPAGIVAARPAPLLPGPICKGPGMPRQPVRSRIPSQPGDQSAGQARIGTGARLRRDHVTGPGAAARPDRRQPGGTGQAATVTAVAARPVAAEVLAPSAMAGTGVGQSRRGYLAGWALQG